VKTQHTKSRRGKECPEKEQCATKPKITTGMRRVLRSVLRRGGRRNVLLRERELKSAESHPHLYSKKKSDISVRQRVVKKKRKGGRDIPEFMNKPLQRRGKKEIRSSLLMKSVWLGGKMTGMPS